MSGGDVAPLGKNAVTELHGLFRWAAKSPRFVTRNIGGAASINVRFDRTPALSDTVHGRATQKS